jgi:hypothetical protein
MFTWDKTVVNKVPDIMFALETLFLAIISMETEGNLFYCTHFFWVSFVLATISENIVPPGFPVNNC